MIVETLTVSPYGTNCYIYAATTLGQAIVIDPGDEGALILRRAEALGVQVATIILTHGHPDHTGALGELRAATGAMVTMHGADTDLLKDSFLASMLGLRTSPASLPDRLLEDGQEIGMAGLVFKVLHTPGHSRGSICLLGDGLVFTGDTLFQTGIGRTDLPGGDYATIVASIQDKLMVLPDDTKVYPGHGPPTTIGYERVHNPFLK